MEEKHGNDWDGILRSPSVHHIDVDPFSLQKFADMNHRGQSNFYGRYKRPSLELFNEHCESIVKEVDLQRSWHKGLVTSIEKVQGFWKVMTKKGREIRARNIVLSIGLNNQLNIPDWVKQLKLFVPIKCFIFLRRIWFNYHLYSHPLL